MAFIASVIASWEALVSLFREIGLMGVFLVLAFAGVLWVKRNTEEWWGHVDQIRTEVRDLCSVLQPMLFVAIVALVYNTGPERKLAAAIISDSSSWDADFKAGYGIAYADGQREAHWNESSSDLSFDWSKFQFLGIKNGVAWFNPPGMSAPYLRNNTFSKFGISPRVGEESILLSINKVTFVSRVIMSSDGRFGVLFGGKIEQGPGPPEWPRP